MKTWIEFREFIGIDEPVLLTRPELYVYLLQIKQLAIKEYGPVSGIAVYEELMNEVLESPRSAPTVRKKNAGVCVGASRKAKWKAFLEAAHQAASAVLFQGGGAF